MTKTKRTFYVIYFLGFIWGWAYTLPNYIQSSFLEQFVDIQYVGYYTLAAAVVTLFAIWKFAGLIQKYSNYTVALFVIILNFLNIFVLVTASNPLILLVAFVIQAATIYLLFINLDIFLEIVSDDSTTGRTRTIFMTSFHVAVIVAALSMGFIAGDDNRYDLVFLIAGLSMIPAAIVLLVERRNLRDNEKFNNRSWKELKKLIKRRPELGRVVAISFILRFFYATMVLFTPLFLNQVIGFSWATIGLIFTAMLIPFIVLQFPAGNIADRYIGEKEILVFGIFIMAASTAAIFFVTSTNVIVWAALLITTRIGASLTEAMYEVYFFKQIDSKDIDVINLVRNMRPVAWIVISVGSIAILAFLDIRYIFLFLAIVILMGLRPALALKDTK